MSSSYFLRRCQRCDIRTPYPPVRIWSFEGTPSSFFESHSSLFHRTSIIYTLARTYVNAKRYFLWQQKFLCWDRLDFTVLTKNASVQYDQQARRKGTGHHIGVLQKKKKFADAIVFNVTRSQVAFCGPRKRNCTKSSGNRCSANHQFSHYVTPSEIAC